MVSRYSYDAWGVPTVLEDHTDHQVTSVNPFLYRTYYYDWEIGMYYLQSRYYDPAVGRFLNADKPIYLGANGLASGYNYFGYCNNNPICYFDPYGYKAGRLFTRADEAAMDFADNYNAISIKNNWEYGTFIYSTKIKKYFCGTKYITVTMYSYYEPWTDKSENSVVMDETKHNPRNYTLVASAHTHAAYNWRYNSEQFSRSDLAVAMSMKMDAYLVTPGGKIYKFDYSESTVEAFVYETYHDSNSKLFFGIAIHSCSRCI